MKKKENVAAAPADDTTEEVVPEVSKGRKIANTIINVILVLAIVLAAVCTYTSYVSSSGHGVPSLFGIRVLSIQTESMYPTLKPGDLIFDTPVKDAGELRVGDIITYWTVINGERVLNTHRITAIYDGGDHLIFQTKGDNNTIEDTLTVHEAEVVGKYASRVGGVGKVVDYLQTSTGFLIVIVLPVFLFFLYHLIQFFRALFEYQNVKNRIRYEQERGRTEDLIEEQKKQQDEARAKIEAELREKLKKELLESMKAEQQKPEDKPEEKPAAPAEEAKEEPEAEKPEETEVSAEKTEETEEA